MRSPSDDYRERVRRAIADWSRRTGGVPDYLDACARCGYALDERRGYSGRENFCSTCALHLDDERGEMGAS